MRSFDSETKRRRRVRTARVAFFCCRRKKIDKKTGSRDLETGGCEEKRADLVSQLDC